MKKLIPLVVAATLFPIVLGPLAGAVARAEAPSPAASPEASPATTPSSPAIILPGKPVLLRGLVIEGMVCVGDKNTASTAASNDDVRKKCLGPIANARISISEKLTTTSDDGGRFKLGPIPHEALAGASLRVTADGFVGASSLPANPAITPAIEQSGHLWVLHTLSDGSADFKDFRTIPAAAAATGTAGSGAPAEVWSSATPALLDLVQKAVDNLSVTDLSGKVWTKASLKGKVTLIEFWGSWCPPCRIGIPKVNEAWEKLQTHGLQVLGIAVNETDAAVLQIWAREHGMTWPQALDDTPSPNAPSKRFGLTGVPSSVLVGKDGKVVGVDLRGRKLLPVLIELCDEATSRASLVRTPRPAR